MRWFDPPRRACLVVAILLLNASVSAPARSLELGPEEIVEADGTAIAVPGYSVPSFVRWDGDSVADLLIGEGGDTQAFGKVRVYLNQGTSAAPQFTSFTFVQSLGSDLTVSASGCLGAFPRVAYWDADERKDLVIGLADGTVRLYLNVATEENPAFDGGANLQVGQPGAKIDIDVGSRATPTVVDWNSDGKKDLVVGSLDGKVYVYLNEGTDAAPDFRIVQFAQQRGADLVVPSARSSPHVQDVDADGRKDLLLGNTDGQLLIYPNTGTEHAPAFTDSVYAEADGARLDLSATRSRPHLCDWNGDGWQDVLIGASDGLVHLFQGREDLTGIRRDGPLAGTTAAACLSVHPNPVRQGTRLAYVLPVAGRARLTIHDARGRLVATLLQGDQRAGEHWLDWGARGDAGEPVAAGVYFVRLATFGQVEVQKVIVVR
jgi:hypothetical protein